MRSKVPGGYKQCLGADRPGGSDRFELATTSGATSTRRHSQKLRIVFQLVFFSILSDILSQLSSGQTKSDSGVA